MNVLVKQSLVILSLGLSLWLLWGFWILDLELNIFLSLLLTATAALFIWHNLKFYQRKKIAEALFDTHKLPDTSFQGTLVLVCGLDKHELSDFYKELQGAFYLSTKDTKNFLQTVHWLAEHRPELLHKVAIMHAILPEQFKKDATLLESVFAWRRAIDQASRYLVHKPEIWSVLYLNPLIFNSLEVGDINQPIWFSARSGHKLNISEGQTELGSLDSWLSRREQENYPLPLVINLEHAIQWLKETYLPLLELPQAGTAKISLQALAIHFIPMEVKHNNLWQNYLAKFTGIKNQEANIRSLVLPFPYMLLTRKIKQLELNKLERVFFSFSSLVMVFLSLAILASYYNNKSLIQDVSNDISVFRTLGSEQLEPKLIAQKQLRDNAQQLTLWQREGIPVSHSVALYKGNSLLAPIQMSLSEWVPPAPQPLEMLVTLDSVDLFDVGKAKLKKQANKVLINALVDIKAKPGWLVIIAGHTDSTGNSEANLRLSRQRAESVRDWMLATSDLSENCFALQGFGDTRPIADNKSTEGRSKNRRVEIRLLPQADACQEVNVNKALSLSER